MSNTTYQKTIIVSQLLVDTQNPRFPDMQTKQNDAIREMIRTQGVKVLALAQHLANNGRNPASLPIVIPTPKGDGKYYVLDGNRRLTALRLLESPELADKIIDDPTLQKIKELSRKYKSNPIIELECVVFGTREQADPWIQLIHRGESQGAGLVKWDGQVAARYDERRGISERGARAALQILDTFKNNTSLSPKTREKIGKGKFPITSLTRLINTPYVRKKIGLQIKDGLVVSFDEKTVRSLAQIVEDFGTEYKTVSDIKRLNQRIDYIDKLFDPHPEKGKHTEAKSRQETTSTSQASSTKKKTNAEVKPRTTIIPSNFLADVTQTLINKIFVELKNLNVDQYPNAGSVVLRVFIELSLDNYLEQTMKWPEQKINNSSLSQKLSSVANDFETKEIMSTQQLASIRKAAGGQTLLVASIKTLHGYVHNKYFSPIPSELKTTWDDIGPFIANVWPI